MAQHTGSGPVVDGDPVWTPIVAALDEGVALVRPHDAVILWCNPAFAGLLASPGVDLVGTPVVVPLSRAVHASDDWRGELLLSRVDGTSGWLDVRVFSVVDPELGPLRAVAVGDSEGMASRTARVNADLAQFASVAAHDLRSPLQAVMGFGELLAGLDSVKADPEATEYASLLLRSVHRMHALVDDLLDYFRVGATQSERAAVDCTALFMQTVEAYAREIAESGAVVTCDDLPVVEADAGLVFVVLSNLVSNALKFHAENITPRVHVRADRDEGEWRFTVTDNGIGIDPRFRERAFEMFRRLQGSEAYAGTGMGLAICKRAVESLHGRIWVDSNAGGGTTVCFTLPVAADPE